MDENQPSAESAKDPREKEITRLRRRVERAEAQLENYERIVDRTQHLLNTRIDEVEAARTQQLNGSASNLKWTDSKT